MKREAYKSLRTISHEDRSVPGARFAPDAADS